MSTLKQKIIIIKHVKDSACRLIIQKLFCIENRSYGHYRYLTVFNEFKSNPCLMQIIYLTLNNNINGINNYFPLLYRDNLLLSVVVGGNSRGIPTY